MNVIQAVQDAVARMSSCVVGMKVLLLDADTAGIVSLVASQTQMMQREVFLFERIDNERDQMIHLKAICFLRPTPENITLLQKELRDPRYGEYYIFFCNIVDRLDQIAQADEYSVVQQVHEYYADYYAVNPDLFNLNIPSMVTLGEPNFMTDIQRSTEGLCSVLLSLKRRPLIRYHRASALSATVAHEVIRRIQDSGDLFQFNSPDISPLLLIFDRRDDPVTPLLLQWTYQAMVHELIGIKKNRVTLPGAREELKEITFSVDQDVFYRDNMYTNFGELGDAVRDLVEQYSMKSKGNANIQSLDDIKKFVETYPEFRQLSGNVSKHVAVMGEVSKQVEIRHLLDVAEFEQILACDEGHSVAYKQMMEFIKNQSYSSQDVLRLFLLYVLRYETDGKIGDVQEAMIQNRRLSRDESELLKKMLKYAGSHVRGINLFGNKNAWQRARGAIKRNLKGVQNIYTRHTPYIYELLDSVVKGRLKESEYLIDYCGSPAREKFTDIIVFVAGGATYQEALVISEFNKFVPSTRFLLGGTSIINSKEFIQNVLNQKD